MQQNIQNIQNFPWIQVYTESVGGLAGIAEHASYFSDMHFKLLIASPVGDYPVGAQDGPYEQWFRYGRKPKVAPQVGGLRAYRKAVGALHNRKVGFGGDQVPGHVSHLSLEWQDVEAGNDKYLDFFQATNDLEASNARYKINIFGLPTTYPIPNHPGWHRFSSFYPGQIALNIANPKVIKHQLKVALHMLTPIDEGGWGCDALRVDAAATLGTNIIIPPEGSFQPAGLEFTRIMNQTIQARWPGRKVPLIAEAGGQREVIAEWLRGGRCNVGYDFGFGPIVLYCLATGNWEELIKYLANSPLIDELATWVLFYCAHDEVQLRYLPAHIREYLISRFGGPNQEYVVFGGNGLTLRLRELTETKEAHVLALALCLLLQGTPLFYMGDAERHSRTKGPERAARRGAFPFLEQGPLHGLPSMPKYPIMFPEDAGAVSAEAQFRNPHSSLNSIRPFINLRVEEDVLQNGGQHFLTSGHPSVMAFSRTVVAPVLGNPGDMVVACNADKWERRRAELNLSAYQGRELIPVMSSHRMPSRSVLNVDANRHQVDLEPSEVQVFRVVA